MRSPRLLSLAARIACVAWFLAAGSVGEATTLVARRELPGLVDESRRAVAGEILAVRYGYDEHRLPATWVTLRVDDAIYGEQLPAVGEPLTLKLFGAPLPLADGPRVFVDGTPRYRAGEHWVLLLIDDSEWGFTQTAGLYQGAFRLTGPASAGAAPSLAGDRRAFGASGLGRWLDGVALTPAERDAVDDATRAVPYRLFKHALIELRGAVRP